MCIGIVIYNLEHLREVLAEVMARRTLEHRYDVHSGTKNICNSGHFGVPHIVAQINFFSFYLQCILRFDGLTSCFKIACAPSSNMLTSGNVNVSNAMCMENNFGFHTNGIRHIKIIRRQNVLGPETVSVSSPKL